VTPKPADRHARKATGVRTARDEHRAYALEKVVPLLRSMPDLRTLERASLLCR
jgi:hypothetical protein